ncbi:MAG: hypothetical protein ACMZ66_04065 [Thalassospira sp.]|uniref:hypothetical protein n=1 Tax=Thalassospira sp. TaxID=1912094 RepID=UPI003A867749
MRDSIRGVNLLRKVKAAALAAALLGGTAPMVIPVAAYAQSSGLIRDIQVEGNNRIESATVNAYLTIKAGDFMTHSKSTTRLRRCFRRVFSLTFHFPSIRAS